MKTTEIFAPMPGQIVDLLVKEGDKVEKGQVLLILEAMKMQNEIIAEEAGTITSINVNVSEFVKAGQKLITM